MEIHYGYQVKSWTDKRKKEEISIYYFLTPYN